MEYAVSMNFTTTEWLLVAIAVIDALMLIGIAVMILHRSPPVAGDAGGTHPILERLRNEPALVSGFLAALATLTASFGFEMSTEQTGAIMAVVIAALAVFTRQQVTPVRKLSPTTEAEITK